MKENTAIEKKALEVSKEIDDDLENPGYEMNVQSVPVDKMYIQGGSVLKEEDFDRIKSDKIEQIEDEIVEFFCHKNTADMEFCKGIATAIYNGEMLHIKVR